MQTRPRSSLRSRPMVGEKETGRPRWPARSLASRRSCHAPALPTCSKLYVTKEHRRHGVARALVERVIEDARIAGQCEVRQHVHPASQSITLSARASSHGSKTSGRTKFSAGWDENRTSLESDVLEVAVRNGRRVLTHVPAGSRPAPSPAQHYFPTEE
jgi:hypothetical protein